MPFRKVDFALHPGRGTGLQMDLAPCHIDAEPDPKNYVHCSETSFHLVEGCLEKFWEPYRNYGHWGHSTIPRSAWTRVLLCLENVKTEIARANSAGDLKSFGAGILAEQLDAEFSKRFARTQRESTRLLEQIATMTENWLSTYEAIRVEGI